MRAHIKIQNNPKSYQQIIEKKNIQLPPALKLWSHCTEQGCFFLTLDAVERCVKNGGLKIMISIKNRKDQIEGENQRESDDSEEKPTVKKRRLSQVVVPLQPKTEVQL